jgi:hypothetical protein
MCVAEGVGVGRPRPTAGIDWASEEHAASVVGAHGVELERFTVEHRGRTCAGAGPTAPCQGGRVGIERPDCSVLDALLVADLTVLVIPPNQVRSLRSAMARKDDSFDAFVLADTVRNRPGRLQPLTVDSARPRPPPARRSTAPPPPDLTKVDHMPTAGTCTDGSDATRRHVLRRRLSLEGRAASALQHWTARR